MSKKQCSEVSKEGAESSNDEIVKCRTAYERHFENILGSTKSREQALESCTHYYLDGKPVRNGLNVLKCSIAFWSCTFWQSMPEGYYNSALVAYALGRSFHAGFADGKVLRHLHDQAPEILKRGIRYSQVFLQPDSLPWQQVLLLSKVENEDFLQFINVCQLLSEELNRYNQPIIDLQRQLDELTIFEFLLYGSLFTFQNLVPDHFDSKTINENWVQLHQSVTDALNELLVYKLKTRDVKDLRLNERFLARSLKRHLIPLLLPGEGSPAECFKNLDVFSKLVAAVIKRNDFSYRTLFEFCLDDDYRYRFDGDHLTIYPVEVPEESEWDFNGRKLSALHQYWFNRAVIEYSESDLHNQQFGLPENDLPNRLAYIKACQVYLQLDEVFGLDSEVSLPDGTQVKLFQAIHSLELMTSFFNVSYIQKFQEYLQETDGLWLKALSLLMMEGLTTGENRFPLTWAEPSEKANRIKSWTISDAHPDGDLRMAEAILEFWTNDLQKLKDDLEQSPNMMTPEFNEQPIIKVGMFGFQLPWLMASQNNATATVNNLRRIGCRRKDRKFETDRIESRLGDLFSSRGFTVLHSYQPKVVGDHDPGEVDLICYQDGRLLICEVKSTYLRKTTQEAWIHRTTTLRKASQQLKRKEKAVIRAIEHDVDLQSKLKLPAQKKDIKIHSWIVDTSIEYDQELIDGYLKVSLESLIVILMNERQLLSGNLLIEGELAEDDMFPDGFTAQQFIDIVERGELWSCLR